MLNLVNQDSIIEEVLEANMMEVNSVDLMEDSEVVEDAVEEAGGDAEVRITSVEVQIWDLEVVEASEVAEEDSEVKVRDPSRANV